MRFSEMRTGDFVIRTSDSQRFRALNGAICMVQSVTEGSLTIKFTDNCVPIGNAVAVPVTLDDGKWYKVNHLIIQANSMICPDVGDVECFNSPVTAGYRNFIGLGNSYKVSVVEAVGELCLIGERRGNGNVLFGKIGYLVAGWDNNGYVIAYRGFCSFEEFNGNRPKTDLCILNLKNTERDFYLAEPIVSACCEAYSNDTDLSVQYTHNILEQQASKSNDTNEGSSIFNSLNELDLEALA